MLSVSSIFLGKRKSAGVSQSSYLQQAIINEGEALSGIIMEQRI